LGHSFTLLWDGAQGLRHAIPISIQSLKQDDLGNLQPPRLVVRHYLGKEIIARVVASRLIGFEKEFGG